MILPPINEAEIPQEEESPSIPCHEEGEEPKPDFPSSTIQGAPSIHSQRAR